VHFVCLCPTYGRPAMPANALQLFIDQDLRLGDTAILEIFDDAGQIANQAGQLPHNRAYRVISQADWIPLPRKYNALLELLGGIDDRPETVYVVWDDDDVYLPGHLVAIAESLEANPAARWAHPSIVYSTYDERTPPLIPHHEAPRIEKAAGRFHGALAICGDLLAELGGWPDTDLATYDQQQLHRLQRYPCANTAAGRFPPYCYRWQDTHKWHCSGSIDAEGRYRQPPIQDPGHVYELVPRYDASTQQILDWLT